MASANDEVTSMADGKTSPTSSLPSSRAEREDMTEDERMQWLRDRGVQIETAEERQRSRKETSSSPPSPTTTTEIEQVSYVLVPHDTSKPMEQLTLYRPSNGGNEGSGVDLLLDHLRLVFQGNGEVDLSLLKERQAQHLLSSSSPLPVDQVSDAALRDVARQGNVEAFRLAPPVPSNRHTAINAYVDEGGMLKRLPLNTRASDLASRAGFNPPPQFYGNVFLGRVMHIPSVRNVDFKLGEDTDPTSASWLRNATMENLNYQSEINRFAGVDGKDAARRQPLADGEDGVPKQEEGYSWTQTGEDIEIDVPLPPVPGGKTLAKDIKVTFRVQDITVAIRGETVVQITLYASVDVSGCTWTLESSGGGRHSKLIISCEKTDETYGVMWPRISE